MKQAALLCLVLVGSLAACTVVVNSTVGGSVGDDDGGGVDAAQGGGGEDNPGEGTGGGGGQSFNMIIKPLVTECVGCHGLGQTQPTLISFQDLQAKYKQKPGLDNILVKKGDISVPVGVHQNQPYFTEAEEATVAQWIESLP
jgi:hypothetical protein